MTGESPSDAYSLAPTEGVRPNALAVCNSCKSCLVFGRVLFERGLVALVDDSLLASLRGLL